MPTTFEELMNKSHLPSSAMETIESNVADMEESVNEPTVTDETAGASATAEKTTPGGDNGAWKTVQSKTRATTVQPKSRATTGQQRAATFNDDGQHVVFMSGRGFNLAKKNPLLLKKALISAFGVVDRIYIAGDCIKVYCVNAAQKVAMLAADKLGDLAIKTSEPRMGFKSSAQTQTRDSVIKGVIVGLSDELTEEEIRAETGATKAVRIMKTAQGRRVRTSAALLIFNDTRELPEYVSVGFTRFRVRAFTPTATRCYFCQAYGHTAKSCRSSARCSRCAGRHEAKDCVANATPQCANCGGRHSAAYKGCIKFKTATTIVKTAAAHGLSYAEALKKHSAEVRAKALAAPLAAAGVVTPAVTTVETPQAATPAVAPAVTSALPTAAAETQGANQPPTTSAGPEPETATAPSVSRAGRKRSAKLVKRRAAKVTRHATRAVDSDSSSDELSLESLAKRPALKTTPKQPSKEPSAITLEKITAFITQILFAVTSKDEHSALKQTITKAASEFFGVKIFDSEAVGSWPGASGHVSGDDEGF